jgi:hypothetical protein
VIMLTPTASTGPSSSTAATIDSALNLDSRKKKTVVFEVQGKDVWGQETRAPDDMISKLSEAAG